MQTTTRIALGFIAVAAIAIRAPGATVALKLLSPQDDHVVQPGDPVDWEIWFRVSEGDNSGLAFLSTDLTQGSGNPSGSCIWPGGILPKDIRRMTAPLGISHPVEGTGWTGAVGTTREANGGADLVQIGGAQNTFGVAGNDIGIRTDVITGLGQGTADWLLTSGTFELPNEPGPYTFELANSAANVLTVVRAAPKHSSVAMATINLAADSITIIVCPGDTSGNGSVGSEDLSQVLDAYGTCDPDSYYDPAADLNHDDCVDIADLDIVLTNFGLNCL